MMCDERCESCGRPTISIGFGITQHCIIPSADCCLQSGVTLLTLLSFYAHTKNKHLRLRIGNAQNRAVMGSVNSVYTHRVESEMRVKQTNGDEPA